MLKKTIRYTDFDGNPAIEDFYFHLSKADLIELEVSQKGGLSNMLERVVESQDGAAIIAEFKKLLLMSYGKKSDDGKRFIKNERLREEFLSSEAYSSLFMELVTNATAATEFVNGIIPGNFDREIETLKRSQEASNEDENKKSPRVLTKVEVHNMEASELQHLLSSGEAIIGD